MARDLGRIIRNSFSDVDGTCRGLVQGRYLETPNNYDYGTKFLEVPINTPTFELPIFMMDAFTKMMVDRTYNDVEAMVCKLYTTRLIPSYVTLNRYMQDIINASYKDNSLVLLPVKQGNETKYYFGTKGAIFNEDFLPLMVCSWIVERTEEDNEESDRPTKFNLIKPIVRIDPSCYLTQNNQMEKFIVKKVPEAILNHRIIHVGSFAFNVCSRQPKIEIDNSPFNIRVTSAPTLSTNNEDLLRIAKEHMDEFLQ